MGHSRNQSNSLELTRTHENFFFFTATVVQQLSAYICVSIRGGVLNSIILRADLDHLLEVVEKSLGSRNVVGDRKYKSNLVNFRYNVYEQIL